MKIFVMKKLKIAVIAGGDSSEYDVSINSANQIVEFIDKDRYQPYLVLLTKKEWSVILQGDKKVPVDKNDFSFDLDGKKTRFDCAYITIHGTPGENGILQGYFELVGMPYTSCGVETSAITFNKYATKQVLRGLNMAKDVILKKQGELTPGEIIAITGLPCFVKPNDSGSSFGITKVKHKDQLEQAIADAFKESKQVIIEEFIEGTEVSCGVIKTAQKEYILPVTEIVPKGDYFDFEAKYNGFSEEITPGRILEKVKKELNTSCSKVYDQLKCRGMVRIDFIIKNDIPYFLEINTIPGMSAASIIPQQIRAAGYKERDIFTEIIEDVMTRGG